MALTVGLFELTLHFFLHPLLMELEITKSAGEYRFFTLKLLATVFNLNHRSFQIHRPVGIICMTFSQNDTPVSLSFTHSFLTLNTLSGQSVPTAYEKRNGGHTPARQVFTPPNSSHEFTLSIEFQCFPQA